MVRLTDLFNMTKAVDWGVKPQTKPNKQGKMRIEMTLVVNEGKRIKTSVLSVL